MKYQSDVHLLFIGHEQQRIYICESILAYILPTPKKSSSYHHWGDLGLNEIK